MVLIQNAKNLKMLLLKPGRYLSGRIPGMGSAGLDIVRDIAVLYGGSLHLERFPLGGVCANREWPAVDELL